MLSAASVAGLLVLTVWQYRTNQHLKQTVRALNDTVTLLQQAPLEAPLAVAPKTDTVYITREVLVPRLVPAPPRSLPDAGQENREDENRLESGLATDGAPEPNRRRSDGTTPASPFQKPGDRPPLEQPGSSERLTDAQKPPNETGSENPGQALSEEAVHNTAPSANSSRRGRDGWNRSGDRRYSARQKPSPGFETSRPFSGAASGLNTEPGAAAPSTGSPAAPAISWEPVLNRTVAFDSSYYAENYQRRVRRIRPLYTPSVATAVAGTARPKKQPEVEEPQSRFRFRLGGGGEIAGGQSGFGLAGEFLVGKHLAIGLGLNRLKLSGDEFFNDLQYYQKRKSDFRRDFPGKVPVDPKIEVLNIGQRAKSWQVPVTLTYRLPIGNQVALLPTAGASFSLDTREEITFTRRKGPSLYDGFKQEVFDRKCEPSLYNSWLVSLGVEKQAGSWALQIMPYLSNPLLSSRSSLNQTTAGFRARILYQF
ncbi:hypothetical protein GCM10027299_54920 [Larkinella ripae]